MPAINPARPAPGTVLAALADLPDPGALSRSFTRDQAVFGLIVTRIGNDVWGFEDRCPHAGLPLSRFDGAVLLSAGAFLVCSAHAASFRLCDGAFAGGPGRGEGLTPVPVRLGPDGLIRLDG